MGRRRHFISWNKPVAEGVTRFLLGDRELAGPVDLRDTLIVVPTTQAGRRLREDLALTCAGKHAALLSVRTVTPAWFLRNDTPCEARTASDTLAKAVMAKVLLDIPPNECRALLPARGVSRDYTWALQTAGLLQGLRSLLADAGLTIAQVPEAAGNVLQEPERWQDLSRLAETYLDRLRQAGFRDRLEQEIRRAESPELPEGVERVVVAAVPAPTPLALRALASLSEKMPVEVLVYAPRERENDFDAWGLPLRKTWCTACIDVPDFERNALLAGSPATQAAVVLGVIAQTKRFGPADVAVGVPDRSVVPFLESAFSKHGVSVFDPAERLVGEHALFKLLEALCALFTEGSWEAFAALLRHPDMLLYLSRAHDVDPCRLLTDLDEFRDRHLPMEFSDIARRVTGADHGRTLNSPALCTAVAFASRQLAGIADAGPATALRRFLTKVFDVQTLVDGRREDEELKGAAAAVDDGLREVAEATETLGIDAERAALLLIETLRTRTYPSERDTSVIDLEGWLELLWNNAPLLVVTGMNEGFVPDTRFGDVFLPESLRKTLGLADDEARMARDAYLMNALIAPRRRVGRAVFIAGKTSEAGEPLKPSRLLFRCRDEDLAHRARRFFGDPREPRENVPPAISFLLNPAAPDDVDPRRLTVTHMSATRFKDYLQCPFRFYLTHVLEMRQLGDEKGGLEAVDYGQMIHDVMRDLGENRELRASRDAGLVAEFLAERLKGWVHARFGRDPALPVSMLLESAGQRLAAAARVHVEQLELGWEIVEQPEQEYKIADLHGMTLRGRIDRIERHAGTKTVRVIDYKTSDTAKKPETEHLKPAREDSLDVARSVIAGRNVAWADLQLPLYALLVSESGKFPGAAVELAYFNMPKAVGDTGVAAWEGFAEEHMRTARECMGRVIEAVRAGRFWPPAERAPAYDDYRSLHFGDLRDFVDGGCLAEHAAKAVHHGGPAPGAAEP